MAKPGKGVGRGKGPVTGGSDRTPKPADSPVVENRAIDGAVVAASGDAVQDWPKIDSALLGTAEGQAAERRASAGEVESAGDMQGADDSSDAADASYNGDAAGEDTGVSAQPPSASYAAADGPPAPVIVERRGGFFPVFLGGVIAAAIGAGAVWFAIPRLPENLRPQMEVASADSARIAEIARNAATEAAREAVAASADGLMQDAREAATEAGAKAGSEAADAALAAVGTPSAADAGADTNTDTGTETGTAAATGGASTAIEERITALEDALAGLSLRAGTSADEGEPEAEGAPEAAEGGATEGDATLASLRADLEAQAKRLDALTQQDNLDPETVANIRALAEKAAAADEELGAVAESAESRIRETVADLDKRLDEASGRISQIADEVEETAARAQAAAAAIRLENLLQQGGPTAEAGAALEAAGVETAQPLPAELPSLAALKADFDDAARAGLKAALQDQPQSGAAGIGAFLRAQTGARSVTPRAGNDPDAILSRAGAAVNNDDIAGALDEIATLPQPAQDAMHDWIAGAEAWRDARAAADSIKTQP